MRRARQLAGLAPLLLATTVAVPGATGCTCGEGGDRERTASPDDAPTGAAPAPEGPAVAPGGHRLVDVAESGPRGLRWLTVGGNGRGRLCEATQPSRVGLPLDVARCADVDPSVVLGQDARVVPAAEANAPPLLIAPGRGLVDRAGRRWAPPPILAAEGRPGAAVAVTEARLPAADGRPGPSRPIRLALEDGDERARTPLPVASSALRAGPVVARGEVWWVADREDGPRLERLGPSGDPAPLPGAFPGAEGLSACRASDGTTALVVDGARDVDAGTRDVQVVFLDARGGAPRAAGGPVGLDAGPPVCASGEVTFAWTGTALPGVDERPVGHELRCRPEGCTAASGPLAIAGTDPAVAEFAGRTLLAWSAADGTRVRLAALPVLERSADLATLPGADEPAGWRAWLVRSGGAILLEGRPGAVRGWRFDATGAHALVEPGTW